MDAAIWSLVETERRTLAELLSGLSAEQWTTRSLCTEWTVRDVAGHLAMTPSGEPGVRTMVSALVRARGHLWSAGREVAVAYARQRTGDELVSELRRDAASHRRPVFVVDENILLDLAVHGQDIAVPLGIRRDVPTATGVLALQRVWAMGWPFHARRRLRDVSLHAADGGWSAGTGPEVRGSYGDLLLLTTGRTDAALDRLDGPGVDVFQRQAHHADGEIHGVS